MTSPTFRQPKYDIPRREPRVAVDRQVYLARGGGERVVAARMVDWSLNGFRVRHGLPLQAGDSVLVITTTATLAARVVWTSKTENDGEAGLALTASENAARRDQRQSESETEGTNSPKMKTHCRVLAPKPRALNGFCGLAARML